MRDYAKVSPRLWTGHTGREIRAAGAEVQVVAMYLVTSPQANMIGLYYQPLPTLCHETGVSPEGASKALRRLAELGFAFYDDGEEVVWVPEMARHQIAEALKPTDKQVPAVEKEAAKHRKSRYYGAFVEKYATAFCLKNLPEPQGLRRASEGPPKAPRSQEQEQEQEQEQKQEQEVDAAAPLALSAPSCSGQETTAKTIIGMWNDMAGRAGVHRTRSEGTRKINETIQRRLKAPGWFDAFRKALAYVEGSDWTRGENERGWKADLDWLLRAGNAEKYGDRPPEKRNGAGGRQVTAPAAPASAFGTGGVREIPR